MDVIMLISLCILSQFQSLKERKVERNMTEATQMDTGPPVSHESEDTYREKFENLKILVQQQQRELQSQKIRNEGVTTITTCLQEEREENSQLRNKIQKLEQSVVTLQSRLSASGHNSNLNVQEGESVLPGPSKQILENLVRENTRLRQSLRQASGDPAHMEHLEKVTLFKKKRKYRSLGLTRNLQFVHNESHFRIF